MTDILNPLEVIENAIALKLQNDTQIASLILPGGDPDTLLDQPPNSYLTLGWNSLKNFVMENRDPLIYRCDDIEFEVNVLYKEPTYQRIASNVAIRVLYLLSGLNVLVGVDPLKPVYVGYVRQIDEDGYLYYRCTFSSSFHIYAYMLPQFQVQPPTIEWSLDLSLFGSLTTEFNSDIAL